MRVGVFYFSLNPGSGRQPIKMSDGQTVYIRAETVEAPGDMEALDEAIIQVDESVMNAHELEKDEFGRGPA